MRAYFLLALVAMANAKPHYPIKLGRRCATLFDEGCHHGGLPGAGNDEEWLGGGDGNPGKRCANLFDEGCSNGGLPGAGDDEAWLGGGGNPGKRCANLFDEGCSIVGELGAGGDEASLNSGLNPGKRCANLFDEGCSNGGLPGAGDDEAWLGGGGNPGKRCANLFDEGCFPVTTPGDDEWIGGGGQPGKRCAGLFDGDKCSNGGLPGAGDDETWIGGGGNPGKRCANLFDEDCLPVVPPGGDEEWLGGHQPGKRHAKKVVHHRPSQQRQFKTLGDFFHRVHMVSSKRCANLFDESCLNGNLEGSNGDEQWLGGNTPGKRWAAGKLLGYDIIS